MQRAGLLLALHDSFVCGFFVRELRDPRTPPRDASRE
jgi:hypothetical protein